MPTPTWERRPCWHASMPAIPRADGRPLPERADVVVIGGGYTGLVAALQLARGRARVTLLEKEGIGFGASSRNGGLLHPGLKWGRASLEQQHGTGLGRAIFQAGIDATFTAERFMWTRPPRSWPGPWWRSTRRPPGCASTTHGAATWRSPSTGCRIWASTTGSTTPSVTAARAWRWGTSSGLTMAQRLGGASDTARELSPFERTPFPGAPFVPAAYRGRPWFLPLAGEWFRLTDRLARRGT